MKTTDIDACFSKDRSLTGARERIRLAERTLSDAKADCCRMSDGLVAAARALESHLSRRETRKAVTFGTRRTFAIGVNVDTHGSNAIPSVACRVSASSLYSRTSYEMRLMPSVSDGRFLMDVRKRLEAWIDGLHAAFDPIREEDWKYREEMLVRENAARQTVSSKEMDFSPPPDVEARVTRQEIVQGLRIADALGRTEASPLSPDEAEKLAMGGGLRINERLVETAQEFFVAEDFIECDAVPIAVLRLGKARFVHVVLTDKSVKEASP